MTAVSQPVQLRDCGPKRRKRYRVFERYDPLDTCPPSERHRSKSAVELARNGSLAAAAKLKCLECACWSHAEVKKCEIVGCPLWARIGREEIGEGEKDGS